MNRCFTLNYILIILFVCIQSKTAFSQSDTAVFEDGHKIRYRIALASGENLPCQWISISVFHSEVMFIGKKRSMVDFGTNLVLRQRFWTAYADYNFSLLESRSRKRSGFVTLGTTQQSYNKTTVYLAQFEGVEKVTNLGLHAGIQRMKNNSHDALPMENPYDPLMAELLVTHELDLGISAWVRKGIFVGSENGCAGRFFIFRFNGDFVFYRFSKFGVRNVNRTVGFSDKTSHSYGEDDEQGLWKFEDLPFRKTGYKMTADFYWHAGSLLGKNAPAKVFGWRARVMVQYVPVSRSADFICCVNFGATFGSKPRLQTGRISVTPLPGSTKNK